jgi:hypothetical protein
LLAFKCLFSTIQKGIFNCLLKEKIMAENSGAIGAVGGVGGAGGGGRSSAMDIARQFMGLDEKKDDKTKGDKAEDKNGNHIPDEIEKDLTPEQIKQLEQMFTDQAAQAMGGGGGCQGGGGGGAPKADSGGGGGAPKADSGGGAPPPEAATEAPKPETETKMVKDPVTGEMKAVEVPKEGQKTGDNKGKKEGAQAAKTGDAGGGDAPPAADAPAAAATTAPPPPPAPAAPASQGK